MKGCTTHIDDETSTVFYEHVLQRAFSSRGEGV